VNKNKQFTLKANKMQQNIDEALTKSFRFQNRELLDNYVILALTDKDGIIKHVSTNFCRVFGYKSSELIDKPYTFAISKDALKSFEIQFNDVKITKALYKGEIKHASSTDNIIWTDTIIEPLFDDDKNLVGFIFASSDITQEKKLKKINEDNLLQKKYDSTVLDFMPNLSAAVLLKTSSSLHKILWIITLFIIVSLLWAYFFKIDDVVKTSGKVITTSNVQTISSLEGGVLDKVFVKEGDFVKKGDVILQISDIAYKSEYDKKYHNKMALQAKLKRLEAQAYGKEIDIDQDVLKLDKKLIDNEISLYRSNLEKIQVTKSILNEQLSQKINELNDNEEKLVIVRNNHKLLESEIKIKKDLVKSRVISEVDYLQLQRRFNDTDMEYKKITNLIPSLRSAVAELKKSIQEAELTFQNESKNELTTTYAEVKTLSEELNILSDQIERSAIKSPSDGVVNQIIVKTRGEAISPGKVLIEIIPDSEFVLAEVKVKPSDIGFLYVSQPVKLKMKAYDFSIYGGLEAEISYIAADTIMDPVTKEEYYTVHIKSNKKYVGTDEKLVVKSGMTVDADIITSKKRIIDFILRPVLKTLQI
jgi:membrane fusion protein, adhesin transport system